MQEKCGEPFAADVPAHLHRGLAIRKANRRHYPEAVICITLMAAIAVASLLVLLFGLLKKPIAAIVFSVLATVAFYALRWDFDDRGVLPSSQYRYGIAEYLYPIAFIVVIAG